MSPSLGSAIRSRLVRFLREFWVYVLLAGLLTTIIASTNQVSDPARVSMLLVGNLLLSTSIGLVCELCSAFAARLLPRARLSTRTRALASLPIFAVGVFAGVALGLLIVRTLMPEASVHFPPQAVLLISVPTSVAMVAVGALREYSQRERAGRREAERQLEGARLSALAARTEPHFLFNSLNSIAALIAEEPEAAERAVLQLAALFRYVLEGTHADLVPLADELAFVRAYLAIEGLRYPERLTVTIEVEPGLEADRVPPLVLQPLVENALRHGLASRRGPLAVVVRVARAGDHLGIVVDDDGPGPGASRHRGSGTSHADLTRRLALLYGERARFETASSPLGGFRAMLTLPRSLDEGVDRRR